MSDKIAVSAFSFHRAILSGRMTQAQVAAPIAALGFQAVEFVDLAVGSLPFGSLTGVARRGWHLLRRFLPFLPTRPGPVRPRVYPPGAITTLRSAAQAAGLQVVAWTMDSDLATSGAYLATQKSYWQQAIAAAQSLGVRVLRCTSGGSATNKDDLATAQRNLRELVQMADGLQVAVENHGGLSGDSTILRRLLDAAPCAGACLDFGNFPAATRTQAVVEMAPYAVHVHAKSFAFNAVGNETRLDYPAYLTALKQANYRGWYSIEYEGPGDPIGAIQATYALLMGGGEGGTPFPPEQYKKYVR